jgi:uncharacterized membrane protein YdjX (TVP38/TMEM64 family)
MPDRTTGMVMSVAGEPKESRSRRVAALRLFLLLAGVAAVIVLGRTVGGQVPQFAAWVNSLGAWGPAVFVAGYVVACVAFIPGSLLTLAAGAIFGFSLGLL